VDAGRDLVPDAAEERRKRKQPGRAAGAASPELRSESGLRRWAEPDTFLAGLGAVAGDGDRGGFRGLDEEDAGLDDGVALAAAEDGMAAARCGTEEEGGVSGLTTAAWGFGQKGKEIAVGEGRWFDVSRSASGGV
jgi:hypothetical protein